MASTSTKHCDIHQITNTCRNPANLSINGLPHIMSRREECSDVVNGHAWTQTIVTLVILTPQNDETHLPKMTTWRSLAEPSSQLPEDSYWTSACIYTVRAEDSLSSIWHRYEYLLSICHRGGEVDENLGVRFYLSLCENAMGWQHKVDNPHTHFHSLVHTMAGLNENQHLSIQFQQLLLLIWFWRLFHHQKIYRKFTCPP